MAFVYEQLTASGGEDYRPELVATDIDGTLINSASRISQRTLNVLRRMYRDEVPLILATGRPPRWIRPITEQLGFNPRCVCSNGAVIYDSNSDQVLTVSALQPEELRQVASVLNERVPDVHIAVERSGGVGSPADQDELLLTEEYNHVWHDPRFRVVSNEEAVAEPAVKVLARHHEKSSSAIAETIGNSLDGIATVTYSISGGADGGLVEISAYHVSKVHGIDICLQELQLSSTNVVAFGDMPNDIAMLQWVGLGVAMGNADPRVRAAANAVTATNDDDGLARVLERWWPEAGDSADGKSA